MTRALALDLIRALESAVARIRATLARIDAALGDDNG
jgi:hypothetical protein